MHFQDSLPTQPIPSLKDTLARFLQSAKPLISEAEYARTEAIVEEFEHGVGQELHLELGGLAGSKWRNSSYITEPWFDMYLKARVPLPINMNPQLTFLDDTAPQNSRKSEQGVRAASLVSSSIRFYRTMRDGQLEPHIFHMKPKKSKTDFFNTLLAFTPRQLAFGVGYMFGAFGLDMSQYLSLFHSTRIPHAGKDELKSYPGSTHIVVQRGPDFYTVNVVKPDGDAVAREQLEAEFNAILSNPISAAPPIGALTTLDRDTWAADRVALTSASTLNTASLEMVDSALFAVCLEDARPQGLNEETLCMLHGSGQNRWFDKSFQLIVTEKGRAAVNFEHAWGDGVAVLRYFDEVYADSLLDTEAAATNNNSNDDNSNDDNGSNLTHKLEWEISSEMAQRIEKAAASFDEVRATMDLDILETDAFDAKFVSKNGMGKDGFLQMSFQLAHYKLNGFSASTYESAANAHYKHGRTETVRSATTASHTFCETMCDPQASAADKETAMRAAIKNHGKLTKEGMTGAGWDRHLFALKWIAEEQGTPIPELYTSKAYATLSNVVLSTSTLNSPALDGGGFGPVGPDCFGIGYGTRDGDGTARFNVTSFGLENKRFIACLEESLLEMKAVVA